MLKYVHDLMVEASLNAFLLAAEIFFSLNEGMGLVGWSVQQHAGGGPTVKGSVIDIVFHFFVQIIPV